MKKVVGYQLHPYVLFSSVSKGHSHVASVPDPVVDTLQKNNRHDICVPSLHGVAYTVMLWSLQRIRLKTWVDVDRKGGWNEPLMLDITVPVLWYYTKNALQQREPLFVVVVVKYLMSDCSPTLKKAMYRQQHKSNISWKSID